MPKSRRRKKKSGRVVKMAPPVEQALREQREAFRAKFGRDWGPGDPVFFDPDANEPTFISPVKMQADILEAMRKAGTPPEIAYAYRKTGLLFTEHSNATPEIRAEWQDAIEEYFASEAVSKNADRPDPEDWSTEIPELLASPFSKDDLTK